MSHAISLARSRVQQAVLSADERQDAANAARSGERNPETIRLADEALKHAEFQLAAAWTDHEAAVLAAHIPPVIQ